MGLLITRHSSQVPVSSSALVHVPVDGENTAVYESGVEVTGGDITATARRLKGTFAGVHAARGVMFEGYQSVVSLGGGVGSVAAFRVHSGSYDFTSTFA
jgi:hypothetical protein